jgi:hypothetical protein
MGSQVLRIGRGPSLQEHIQALRTVAQRYGISKVFCATDDPAVVEGASSLAPELTFMHYQFNRCVLFRVCRRSEARTSFGSCASARSRVV